MIFASLDAAQPAESFEHMRSLEAGGIVSGFHLDVADERLGLSIVRELRGRTDLPVEVHLFEGCPVSLALRVVHAGARRIVLQAEDAARNSGQLAEARRCGVPVGVAISSSTPADEIRTFLEHVDYVCALDADCVKAAEFRRVLREAGSGAELGIEGGVGVGDAARFFLAGANDLIIQAAVLANAGRTGVCT